MVSMIMKETLIIADKIKEIKYIPYDQFFKDYTFYKHNSNDYKIERKNDRYFITLKNSPLIYIYDITNYKTLEEI